MRILVCVKRVPAPGAKIVLTEDGQAIDTRHLGFTVSPHEECAVEEAVRITEQHGGEATVLTLGPPEAEDQLRTAISMGVHHGVLLPIDETEWDAVATARAIAAAVRTLEEGAEPFDLLLFGNESADAGNYQVGIRVATLLARPVVSGVKQIDIGQGSVGAHRAVDSGFERCTLPLPAVLAVKEGINLPRYPAMRGRLLAKKAEIRHLEPIAGDADFPGLVTLRMRHPAQQQTETVMLGAGADAAGAIVDVFEQVGAL